MYVEKSAATPVVQSDITAVEGLSEGPGLVGQI